MAESESSSEDEKTLLNLKQKYQTQLKKKMSEIVESLP